MKRPRGGGQRKGEERGQVEEKSKGKKKNKDLRIKNQNNVGLTEKFKGKQMKIKTKLKKI